MIRIGLSSTALLSREYRDVLGFAREAGFDAIEWAGDLRASGFDPRQAEDLLMDTLRAGLAVASYAATYRAESGEKAGLRFEALLAAAAILQTPIVRVFAGSRRAGPRTAPERDPSLAPLAREARRLGDLAARKGITVCISPGIGTWADSYEAAAALVEATAHPFVRVAWEPLPNASPEAASAALERLGGSAGLIVARKIGRDGLVGRLADEEAEWRRRLAAFKAAEHDPKMSSFVLVGAARGALDPGDILPDLKEDASFLKGLAAEVEGRIGGRK